MDEKFIARFWSKVDRRGPDECWPWRVNTGRHVTAWSRFHRSNRTQAHRLAWEIANGPIPEGLWVLHRCDNPPCCNPAHLEIGTVIENNRSSAERNRRPFSPLTRLTEEAVWDIKARLGTIPQARLAEQYEVSRSLISRIKIGLARAKR